MDEKQLTFRTDLYQGAAGYYDPYRPPYPASMLADLAGRAGLTGHGRLLDLACGTGQLGFPLRHRFAQVWAVDREPDMVRYVQTKAADEEAADVIRAIAADAETLDAAPGSFELVVIGSAFHRLDRDRVARLALDWLEPGGHLALCWASSPWAGEDEWHRAFGACLERWIATLGAHGRAPATWDQARRDRPDAQVLAEAGFEVTDHREFLIEHRWSVADLAGLVRSTSFLPGPIFGDRGAEFDADLAATLSRYCDEGAIADTVSFAYDLARKPR